MEKPKKNKLKAERRIVGYVRVSTIRQVAVGESLERQTDRIREWAGSNDYKLIDIEEDVGSARHEGGVHEREGLQSLIRTANREKAAVVVTSWDRLSRSAEGIDRILKQLPGRRLFALDDEQDHHYHSYGQKRSVILDRVRAAEDEAVATASATRQALERKKASGMKLGSPRAGSRGLRSANIERIVRADLLAEEIARVLQSDPGYDGLSHSGLAKLLNKKGLKTTRGGAFTRDNVRGPRKRASDYLREQQELDADDDVAGFKGVTLQTDCFSPEKIPGLRMPKLRKGPSVPASDAADVTDVQDERDEHYRGVPLFGSF